jgi:polysaccharide export outer membrane protein
MLFHLSLNARAQEPAQPASQIPAPAQALASAAPAVTSSNGPLSYQIGPGDELDVRVFGHAELGRVVRVDSFGRIRLPFLNDIPAGCMTESQLADTITEKYKKYLNNPQVDVLVKDYRSQPVAVIGAVANPGRFQLQRRVRLLELITFAGGPNGHAGGTVHVIHSSEHSYCKADAPVDQPKAVENKADEKGEIAKAEAKAEGDGDPLFSAFSSIKLRDVLNGATSANPFIQPGDIVSIPEADQIFVTGSVVKPGAYPMLNKITLTQAVALAGGINQEGARNRVRLVRQEPGSEQRSETIYNLDDILKRKIQDITLTTNDIVEVPSSTMRAASRNVLGVSISMLSALPYFIIR